MKGKPIETFYAGCRFRSRLEARWAVLFDSLGIRWDYEPEGFDLGECGYYLPDFFLHLPPDDRIALKYPGAGYWVEIKGGEPTREEALKCEALTEATKHYSWIFQGNIGDQTICSGPSRWTRKPDANLLNLFNVCGYEPAAMKGAYAIANSSPIYYCSKQDDSFFRRVDLAIEAARSARFEFGEVGA